MRAPLLRYLLGGALLASLAMTTARAEAADVQACMSAFETGQKYKIAGKFRAAREQFVACGDAKCPAMIRHDCAQFNSDLANLVPSVVFGAHDKAGKDLFDVTVSMDGEVLTKKLDGKAVNVDPGKHTFTFEVTGLPAQSQTALIKEGERARPINVTFDSGKEEPGPAVPDDGKKKDQVEEKGGHSALPWVLVGIGAAAVVGGVVVALTAPERPANCDPVTKLCRPEANEPPEKNQEDRSQAAAAESQPVVGWVIAGVGGAFIIGGLVWHFVEPTDPPKKSDSAKLRFAPWTTGVASGFSLGGRF